MAILWLTSLFSLWLCAVNGQTSEGTIQLIQNGVASPLYSSGRLQVWFNSQWSNVCGDKTTSPFSINEGDVVCRQLGYTGASSVTIAADAEDSYGFDSSPILVDQFDCSIGGPYTVLFQCTFSTLVNVVNCDDNDDVGVSCYTNRLWDDPFPGMVRLQNGTYSNEGSVEVFCNGLWTPICGSSFTTNDADTVCMQLGYKGAQTTKEVDSVSAAQWFETLSCTSPEPCITGCQSCPNAQSPPHSCSTDAHVQCHYESPSTKDGSTQYQCTLDYYPRGEGAVKLARGNLYSKDYSSGRVQVYYDGVWGNVCQLGGFNTKAADVICHQLGWTGASEWSYSSVDSFPVDIRVTHYDNIGCTSSQYLVLQQCSYRDTVVDSQCTDDNDVSIACYTTRIWDNPFPGMIRLTGTNFINEGRVEVYCNGEWGTVCNRNYDSNDRRVICQQLGYNQVFETSDLSLDPATSTVPVWLDNLACLDSDNYKCISNCQPCLVTPSTDTECSLHTDDITIQCYIDSDSEAISQDFSDCQITDTSIVTPVEGTLVLQRQGLDSSSFSSGIVVLYHLGEWGNICKHSSISAIEADVICHQMTYTGASALSFDTNHEFGIDTRNTRLTDLSCPTGKELTVLQCSYKDGSDISASCDDTNDLIVTCYESRLWDDPFSGMVRLMDGYFNNEGRIEVYCSGQWGTVCDDTFDIEDRSAVCRQLGYSVATSVSYTTISVDDNVPIWLDNLQCLAKPDIPSCINTCQVCPTVQSSKCSHSNDATIQCSHNTVATNNQPSGLNQACHVDSMLPGAAQSGAIVLGQNGNYSNLYTNGRVLVNYNSRWGTICRKNSFGNTEADVICHQLTYSGASSWSYGEQDNFGSDPSLPMIFRDISCSDSNYLTIFQCALTTTITDCSANDAVSVTCYSSRIWNNPFDSSIRLSSGNYVNEGLLEVNCNNEWGTVCDDDAVNMAIAGATACRQLGYHSYRTDHSLQITGTTNQKIWLDSLSCTDASNCISDCQQCPSTGSSQCDHDQDVSVQCIVSENSVGESNSNVIESCSHKVNYLVYIIAGSCGGGLLLLIAVVVVACCIRIQRNNGNCPKPCGKWEVEIDEANAKPLTLSMTQRHRRAPIVVPIMSKNDPPPYDLTNAPPFRDPNNPPDNDSTNANEHCETVNPIIEEQVEENGNEDLPPFEGLDNIIY